MPKEIQFNEADLLNSMQQAVEHAQGVRNLKTTQLAKKAAKLSATKIQKIRRAFKASTPVFAAYLNVSPDTVRSWEKNRKHPSGPALRLLELAENHPEVFISHHHESIHQEREIPNTMSVKETGSGYNIDVVQEGKSIHVFERTYPRRGTIVSRSKLEKAIESKKLR